MAQSVLLEFRQYDGVGIGSTRRRRALVVIPREAPRSRARRSLVRFAVATVFLMDRAAV
jgi:hypothetical protein